jgi:hypothetical protein
MQLIKYLTGLSLKDTVSNVASLMGLAGSLIMINIQSGNIPHEYGKQAKGLIGMSIAVVGFVTGKNGTLTNEQDEN